MSYLKHIEQYKIIGEFHSPLASNPGICANCKEGDTVFIIDNEVWVTDEDLEREEQFAKPVYDARFVRLNSKIFVKVD